MTVQGDDKNISAAEVPVVTIDGPSGSGKGTIAYLVAKELGFHLLDSGALYRLTAFGALKRQIDLNNESALAVLAENLDVQFVSGGSESSEAKGQGSDNNSAKIILDGEDVTSLIRTEDIGNAASKIAALSSVRTALLNRQKQFRASPGLVADGRDMGTVVFPDAILKLYLTASAEERAERRYKQLKNKGGSVSLAQLFEEIKARDDRDLNREVAPLKPAIDAIIIDSSGIGIQEVLDKVLVEANRAFAR